MHNGIFAHEFEHPLEGEAQTEPSDEDAGFGHVAQFAAAEVGEQEFGDGGDGAHQLPAVVFDIVLAVMLVQRDHGAIRGTHLRECLKRNHRIDE